MYQKGKTDVAGPPPEKNCGRWDVVEKVIVCEVEVGAVLQCKWM
jgi:hypothetical protein